eukprot:1039801-Prorocentrum_minimum.AAC.1
MHHRLHRLHRLPVKYLLLVCVHVCLYGRQPGMAPVPSTSAPARDPPELAPTNGAHVSGAAQGSSAPR